MLRTKKTNRPNYAESFSLITRIAKPILDINARKMYIPIENETPIMYVM
jgi:hypothetical protein